MNPFARKTILLLAGATASGKSSVARTIAQRWQGEIINADAIQVYRDLRILSARPSPQDEASVPHHLYGFAPAETAFSSGAWLSRARELIDDITGRGRLPILVGGTGLYFRCLTQGLAEIPKTPPHIRDALRRELDESGAETLYARLSRVDPVWAGRIPASDSQRLLRGLEVWEATGKPLSVWLGETPAPDPSFAARLIKIALTPPRETLYERCDSRARLILEMGAADEARNLLALGLPSHLPVMKAIGLAPLGSYLAGEIALDAAAERVAADTRRYARRQMTWIRNQMPDWTRSHDPSPNSAAEAIDHILRETLASKTPSARLSLRRERC